MSLKINEWTVKLSSQKFQKQAVNSNLAFSVGSASPTVFWFSIETRDFHFYCYRVWAMNAPPTSALFTFFSVYK